jgi:hypothetical protein
VDRIFDPLAQVLANGAALVFPQKASTYWTLLAVVNIAVGAEIGLLATAHRATAETLTVLETEWEGAAAWTDHRAVAAPGGTGQCDSGVGVVIYTGSVQAEVEAASVHVIHTDERLEDVLIAAVAQNAHAAVAAPVAGAAADFVLENSIPCSASCT